MIYHFVGSVPAIMSSLGQFPCTFVCLCSSGHHSASQPLSGIDRYCLVLSELRQRTRCCDISVVAGSVPISFSSFSVPSTTSHPSPPDLKVRYDWISKPKYSFFSWLIYFKCKRPSPSSLTRKTERRWWLSFLMFFTLIQDHLLQSHHRGCGELDKMQIF